MSNEKVNCLNKHLKDITTSTNYKVELSSYGNIELRFYTKKYLHPYAILHEQNYIIIEHFYNSNNHDYLELLHSLIVCNKVKQLRESNMPLHTFINEVIMWFGMCTSLIAYGYRLENSNYLINRSTYNLPVNTKQAIYEYAKTVINNIKYSVYTDGEGNSYNSIQYAEV